MDYDDDMMGSMGSDDYDDFQKQLEEEDDNNNFREDKAFN